jgi:hypothetical protein
MPTRNVIYKHELRKTREIKHGSYLRNTDPNSSSRLDSSPADDDDDEEVTLFCSTLVTAAMAEARCMPRRSCKRRAATQRASVSSDWWLDRWNRNYQERKSQSQRRVRNKRLMENNFDNSL